MKKHTLLVIFIVAVLIAITIGFNHDTSKRRDNFLIEQCLKGRTTSITFADGSKTYCLVNSSKRSTLKRKPTRMWGL